MSDTKAKAKANVKSEGEWKESEAKPKSKVKSDGAGEESATPKLSKSPQAGDGKVKVKKEAKQEPESPPVAKKKHSHNPVKAVKKETEVPIDASKKEERSKTAKGDSTGKVKVVKKEEVVVSSVTHLKKKKPSKDEPEKKEKKVYSFPGQKHDPPDERDPLRIFYETLYGQNSKSEMAEVWMMEHGLLEVDVAKKAFERKKKNQVGQKPGTPVKQSKEVKVEKKSSTAIHIKSQKKSPIDKDAKKSRHSNADSKPSKVKRVQDSDNEGDDDDDDFIAKPKKKIKRSP